MRGSINWKRFERAYTGTNSKQNATEQQQKHSDTLLIKHPSVDCPLKQQQDNVIIEL
jgi:hypothetical protein